MDLVSAYNGDKPFAFISYSHKDTDVVLQIISQMQSDGYRLWYDEGIEPGVDWDEYIASRINKSSYFIVFLSENYLNSSNCKDEMNYARDRSENILLIYLEPVNMTSGMEMRFGRSQAIFAYNYEVKAEFFNKLYLSENINLCKGNDDFGIVEESIENISTETYVSEPVSVPEMPVSENPTPVNEPVIPEIKVQRVPVTNTNNKNRKLMWIIIAIAVLVIALVVIGIIVASNSSSKKNSETKESFSTEITEEKNKDEDSSDKTETTTTSETEAIVKKSYSSYGLSAGMYTYFVTEADLYNNIGEPVCYNAEKEKYVQGVFVDTYSMFILIPVMNDYSEPIWVKWYYVEPDGTEKVVSEISDIYPTPDEGVSWYELYLSDMDMDGNIPDGEYYAVVYAAGEMDESLIIKVEHQSGD